MKKATPEPWARYDNRTMPSMPWTTTTEEDRQSLCSFSELVGSGQRHDLRTCCNLGQEDPYRAEVHKGATRVAKPTRERLSRYCSPACTHISETDIRAALR